MKAGELTKGIIGSVIGDIAGSAHEFRGVSRPSFKMFTASSSFTDDTALTMAGGIAAAFWGVPDDLARQALLYLPPDMIEVINAVDGTAWRPTGITPPDTHRWRTDDVVVYGANATDTEGEQGFYDVRPSRYHHHFNKGYRIVTMGATLDEIALQIDALKAETEAHPERRFLVREIGISKAGCPGRSFQHRIFGIWAAH